MPRFLMGQRTSMVALIYPPCIALHVPDAALALCFSSGIRVTLESRSVGPSAVSMCVMDCSAGDRLSSNVLCQSYVLKCSISQKQND